MRASIWRSSTPASKAALHSIRINCSEGIKWLQEAVVKWPLWLAPHCPLLPGLQLAMDVFTCVVKLVSVKKFLALMDAAEVTEAK